MRIDRQNGTATIKGVDGRIESNIAAAVIEGPNTPPVVMHTFSTAERDDADLVAAITALSDAGMLAPERTSETPSRAEEKAAAIDWVLNSPVAEFYFETADENGHAAGVDVDVAHALGAVLARLDPNTPAERAAIHLINSRVWSDAGLDYDDIPYEGSVMLWQSWQANGPYAR